MTTPNDYPTGASDADAVGDIAAGSDVGGAGVVGGAGDPDKASLSGCDFLASVAAEFALGSLTGAERSVAIAHLDSCESCRAEMKDLSSAADALLLVAPEIDPPAGFEVRLLARRAAAEGARSGVAAGTAGAGGGRSQDADGPPASETAQIIPLRRRPRAILAGAAAAVVIAAAGVGIGLAAASRPAGHQVVAASAFRVATLRATDSYSGTSVGQVVISNGQPSWVLMSFDRPGWTGWVDCVVAAGGRSWVAGRFYVSNGNGSWGVRLGSTSGQSVTSARIVLPNGPVLAVANFG